jgi:hypothetical protein
MDRVNENQFGNFGFIRNWKKDFFEIWLGLDRDEEFNFTIPKSPSIFFGISIFDNSLKSRRLCRQTLKTNGKTLYENERNIARRFVTTHKNHF